MNDEAPCSRGRRQLLGLAGVAGTAALLPLGLAASARGEGPASAAADSSSLNASDIIVNTLIE